MNSDGKISLDHILDIWDLVNILSSDWQEGKRNKFILAGKDFQFVRDPKSPTEYPNTRKRFTDIPILSANYSMIGFIVHDCHRFFDGMFKTSKDNDGVCYSAELTKFGFDVVKSGFSFNPLNYGLKSIKFFNPSTNIASDVLLLPNSI